MSTFRASKRGLRIDGAVRGIKYVHGIFGPTRPSATGHAAQYMPMTGYAADDRPASYDPGHGTYEFPDPHYAPADPGPDALAFAAPPTQPVSLIPTPDSVPMEPALDHELAGWLNRRFVNEATLHSGEVQELFDPNHVPTTKIGEIAEHLELMRDYSEAVVVGDMVDAVTDNYFVDPSPNQLWSEAVTQMAEGMEAIAAAMQEFGEQPEMAGISEVGAVMNDAAGMPGAGAVAPEGAPEVNTGPVEQFGVSNDAPLEQIVNDEMMRMDPYSTMDPNRMMNPYGILPPGMGPIGPM